MPAPESLLEEAAGPSPLQGREEGRWSLQLPPGGPRGLRWPHPSSLGAWSPTPTRMGTLVLPKHGDLVPVPETALEETRPGASNVWFRGVDGSGVSHALEHRLRRSWPGRTGPSCSEGREAPVSSPGAASLARRDQVTTHSSARGTPGGVTRSTSGWASEEPSRETVCSGAAGPPACPVARTHSTAASRPDSVWPRAPQEAWTRVQGSGPCVRTAPPTWGCFRRR